MHCKLLNNFILKITSQAHLMLNLQNFKLMYMTANDKPCCQSWWFLYGMLSFDLPVSDRVGQIVRLPSFWILYHGVWGYHEARPIESIVFFLRVGGANSATVYLNCYRSLLSHGHTTFLTPFHML